MITEEMIPRIEKAFGFQLYDWQKDYLLGKRCIIEYGRNNGKTFVYCVEILLSDGEPIKRRDLFKCGDGERGKRYWRWFAECALEINDKLVAAGFETRVEK